jgi:hypothetical protein
MAESDKILFVCPKWLKAEIRTQAEFKGVNMSEYIKDVLKANIAANVIPPNTKKPRTEKSMQG